MDPQLERKAATRGPPSSPRAQSPIPPSPGAANGPAPRDNSKHFRGTTQLEGETHSAVSETSQSSDSGSAAVCSLNWPLAASPAPQIPAGPVLTRLRISCVCVHAGGGHQEHSDQVCDAVQCPAYLKWSGSSRGNPVRPSLLIRVVQVPALPSRGPSLQGQPLHEVRPAVGAGHARPPPLRPGLQRGLANVFRRAGPPARGPPRGARRSGQLTSPRGRPVITPLRFRPQEGAPRHRAAAKVSAPSRARRPPGATSTPRVSFGDLPDQRPLQGPPRGHSGRWAGHVAHPATPPRRCT
ncbi:hypothetical protein NDU88_002072 [Pleurodeles waltl]|uniref:Uncharacterized protein n=1 Tax=Pleurodeles waltl TaxID=8319 RepID=A0AAV7TKR5_PLEWA|nr:hypothetical protein NDU88_002072 [Pleurodeles waltl]